MLIEGYRQACNHYFAKGGLESQTRLYLAKIVSSVWRVELIDASQTYHKTVCGGVAPSRRRPRRLSNFRDFLVKLSF